MHDGNQRYKIHVRPRGRHRGEGTGHAEAQSAVGTPGNAVPAKGAAPGNAAGPALARDGEVTAGGGALHAPGARLLHAHAPGGQPAQQTGGQPHGAKPAAIFPHAARGAHSPGQGSQESRGKRNRQGVFHRESPQGQEQRRSHRCGEGRPFLREEAADRQSHTPK